VTDKAGYRD